MNSHTSKIDFSGNLVSEKLKNFSEKNREESLEKNRKMMMESALESLAEDMDNSYSYDSGYTT